ncbi:hypothetical protein [Streptomyces sp. SudanB182_2057]|uniref:hypothetical protein n=1 Tax=Streptomyces sp. SudanB182_2057 TaxID=3035281 RepID=UPI003F55D87E
MPAQAATTAQVASAPQQKRAADVAAASWYLYGYYTWKSDCADAGRMGIQSGWWSRYECKNGSWVPGDDYELWVYG